MSNTLSIALRPRSLSQVFGQEAVVAEIRDRIYSERVPRAWLFTGESGAGKTTLSRIIALALQHETWENFGELTDTDWEMLPVYDIREINGSAINGVDAMRELIQTADYLPSPPTARRVIIIDEAHRLTKNAQDVLLKPCEAEEGSTIWIFSTNEPDKLLETLRRRCTRFSLAPMKRDVMEKYLAWAAGTQGLTVDTKQMAELLAAAGITSPGVAIQALEAHISGKTIEQAVTSASDPLDSRELCRALLQGNWEPLQKALDRYTADDIRSLRYMLLGYLRKVVVNGKGSRTRQAAEMIAHLTDSAPGEDAALIPWITAKLYLLCNHSATAALGKAA
jgi:DNA polymerase III gamma/tau subunit